MNKPTADHYKEIAIAAITKNESRVGKLLAFGVNAQLAQLYTEQIHSDAEAGKLIHQQAHCECGNLAIKFSPPICAGCSLSKAFSQIQYGVVGSAEVIPTTFDQNLNKPTPYNENLNR